MASLIQALQAKLEELAPAGGVWFGLNPGTAPVLPYIVHTVVVNVPNNTLRGPSDLSNTRVQTDVYARTLGEMLALQQQLDELMLAWEVRNLPLDGEPMPEPDIGAFRYTRDWSIWSTHSS